MLRTVITQTHLDIVTDSYQPSLITISERHRSSLSSKIYIRSSNQEYLAILATFYQTVKKKREWLRLYFVYFRKKTNFLSYLKINQFIISKQNLSKSITLSAVRIVESPSSNQVEADKKSNISLLSCIKILLKF